MGSVQIRDGDAVTDVDKWDRAVITQAANHHNIHLGRTFTASYLDESVANDASLEFLVQTGALQAHMGLHANGGGSFELYLFEGTTVSAAGTSLAAVQRNRTSSTTATATVTHTPTITADGTQLEVEFIAGGTGGIASGSQGDFHEEWVLAPNTNYLVRVKNVAGVAEEMGLIIDWYEPTIP